MCIRDSYGLAQIRHRTERDGCQRDPRVGADPCNERVLVTLTSTPPSSKGLVDAFERGLYAPICLTGELTYACNLSCVHCLSSSGRRDPRELSTAEAKAVIDELERMQVFYCLLYTSD